MTTPNLGRVLIVDDEIELMTALCETLTEQRYEAVGFTSAAEALKLLQEREFDLLLSDLMMPEMDGIALLRAALAIDPYLVGIIMTGQGTIQTAVDAMKGGAFDYVLKPFKLQALLPVLSRAQDVRRLRLENLQLRETVAIYELGQAIAYTFDMNTILNKVADGAMQQVEPDEASVMLPTPDGEALFIAAVRGEGREGLLGKRVPIEQSIAGWVARNRQPLTLHGAVSDPRFAPMKPRDGVTAISLPMLAGGKLVGVLNVNDTHRRRPFTFGQVKALSIFANVAAVALEGVSQYAKVQQAEAKYRSIFENAVEGIFQATPDGRYITANPSLARILGYVSPEELIASVTDIACQIYVAPTRRAEFTRLIQEHGAVTGFESRLYRKDASVIWVSESARAVRDDNGAVLYYEGAVEDITARKQAEEELKESEERFRSVAESATDAIMLSDSSGNILSWNHGAQAIFGYAPEDILGRPVTMLMPERDRDACSHGFKRVAATGERRLAGKPVELRGLKRDGSEFPLELSLASWNTGEGTFFSAIVREITDRKRAEAELQQQREALYQSEKLASMGQLLAGVAHELNNPLTVVIGQTALLCEMAGEGPLGARAEKIAQAAERCARIVKNFLALARQRPSERQQVRINQVVQEAVELLAYPLRVDNVEVALDLATDLPLLWADPHQLHQVVVNLVTNAHQAMHETPPPRRITLATRFDPTRGQVSLEVADSGPGILPEIQPRLFEPFFTTKPAGQGTGLGLSLCQGIIESHNGTIRVASSPGQGAVFRIELPVEVRRTLRPEIPAVEALVPLRGRTILVVDDEPEVAGMLADLLSADGQQVETAANGVMALEKLGERAYDLIVSDLRMPELDGPGLYREVERRHPQFLQRLIFLTGDALSPEILEFLERIRTPTVSKPFTLEAVRRVVQRVLRATQASDDSALHRSATV